MGISMLCERNFPLLERLHNCEVKNPPQSPFAKGGRLEAPLFDKEGLGEIRKSGLIQLF